MREKFILGCLIASCLSLYSALALSDNQLRSISLSGQIKSESYLSFKQAIESSPNTKELIINSLGGDFAAAVAIGKLVKLKGLNVKVEGACASACANYIFIAGNKKIIARNAVVLFHGGMQQEGFFDAAKSTKSGERSHTNGASFTDDGKGAPPDYILSAIGMKKIDNGIEAFPYLVKLEKRYFSEMKVKNELPTFGQKGRYKEIWSSMKYLGFYYDLPSLKKLGVKNIEVEGGEWHPEENELFSRMYEVKYP